MRPGFVAVLALFILPAALSGCAKKIEAPTDARVCWAMAVTKDGKAKFNRLADNVPDLEHCAAQLEAMRVKFMGLGGTQSQITGSYQGAFLFLQKEGVFTAQSYDGVRYPFMVRTGDGRLAVPGAMPQQ
jgi:hypothetical protein